MRRKFSIRRSTKPNVIRRLKANALARTPSLRAEHRPADRHDPALCRGAGGNVIVSSTPALAIASPPHRGADDQLNTLTMPWLEAIGAGAKQVTHVVIPTAHRPRRLEHGQQDGNGCRPSEAKYLFPKAEFDYWKAEYAKDKPSTGSPRQRAADLDAGLAEFIDGRDVAGA
jgi:hypothetical protein